MQWVPKDKKCWCGNPLEVPGQARKYSIDGEPVCKNCYFGDFGATVEKHPIGGGLRPPIEIKDMALGKY